MKRYKTVSGYVVRQFLDEYLIIPVDSPGSEKARFGIQNDVGQYLWNQLQVERTFDELVTNMCAEYEVSEQTAAEDIREFLEVLEKNHCLNVINDK